MLIVKKLQVGAVEGLSSFTNKRQTQSGAFGLTSNQNIWPRHRPAAELQLYDRNRQAWGDEHPCHGN